VLLFCSTNIEPKADAEDYIQLVPAKTGSFQ